MEILKINETPVRTSKNFNINNIKIENIEIPNQLKEFKNVAEADTGCKININEEVDEATLKYGLNEFLTEQVNKNSNCKRNIIIDSKTPKEYVINLKMDDNNPNLVDNINIIANEDSKATVILKYETIEDVCAYHNGIIRATAHKNSVLNIIVVNFINDISNNFIAIQNKLEENAKINYYIIDFGGKYSITNYYSNVEGKNADNRLNALYIGRSNQIIDLNYIGELYGEKSNINIEVQGALKDNAKKHFKGTIDFKKGCKKATGNENENCVLLSDKAKSMALPMLLCSEEDVEGNHSTSAGKLDSKDLFYVMSRGFDKKEAMKLMVKAKFNKILDEIKNEELRSEILGQIDNLL